MIDFRLPTNELSSINETIIPLTFLAPNGTLTLDPTNKDFFKFSGIEYVKFGMKIVEAIPQQTL